MSNTDKNKEFYDMADAFIAVANKQCKKRDPGTVSATFLYAAARYNTFIAASGSESADKFSAHKEDFLKYFLDEYKKMLEEHFEDYSTHFEKYLGQKN